ncbi:MAG: hypothetical protein NVS3B3_03150 [Aquirhabdus sp.]
MIELSSETVSRIRALFNPTDHTMLEDYLRTECGDNLPLVDECFVELAERIRFAVIKLSEGNLESLIEWVEKSKIDWRDTLVAAGFASSLRSHLSWHPNQRF